MWKRASVAGGGTPSLTGVIAENVSAGAGGSAEAAYPYGKFIANVIGVNSVSFEVTYKSKIYGWVGSSATLIGDYVSGTTHTIDVSAYERLSALRSVSYNAVITNLTAIS